MNAKSIATAPAKDATSNVLAAASFKYLLRSIPMGLKKTT